jgi:hypothetical protein
MLKRTGTMSKYLCFRCPFSIYIQGQEFTMGGKRVRLEPVVCPKKPDPSGEKQKKSETPDAGKVISLADLKKK